MIRAAAAALALALASCGDGASAKSGAGNGADLFASQGCTTCHGQDGAGTELGPTLQGKKSFWTREKISEYLRNPVAYAEKDARLSEQARRYTFPMQPFDKLTTDEMSALAEHVLALP
jgi:mono/diheme cytochrome c family protein